MDGSDLHDFDSFCQWLVDVLAIDRSAEGLTPETTLVGLELDSLQLAELWIACEEIGMDLPEELFFSLQTVGDIHHYYLVKVTPTEPPPGEAPA